MHRSTEESSIVRSTSAEDRQLMAGDTIAAISTPAGEGAIALVRISGADSIAVADKICRAKAKPSEFASRVQHFGDIVDETERLIDQVMMSIHRAPTSYTGEDLVEISCHGGMLVSTRVLEACLRAGARAARPGEFTERAFLNGKMDLTQAEAVIDLIRAKTDLALRSATDRPAPASNRGKPPRRFAGHRSPPRSAPRCGRPHRQDFEPADLQSGPQASSG